MLKNKAPQEQPTNPVERDKEATQWLVEQLRKIGWKSPQAFAVWKVVAQKVARIGTQEAVFIFPAYNEGQIKRYLMFQGWETIAAIQYADISTAREDSDDPNVLKTKGLIAQGSG